MRADTEGSPGPSNRTAGFASLGSGSRGNGTLVRLGRSLFLVDCGFTLKQTETRLQRLGVRPGELTAILVSHEHSDHVAGVAALAHRYAIPVFATHGTRRAARRVRGGIRGELPADTITGDRPFEVDGIRITPVTVPHDAREPVQFVFESAAHRFGVLSDLGQITPHVVAGFSGLDGLLLESNHDRTMLLNGRYPASVKRRIAGDHGHLSNEQAAELLAAVAHPALSVVVGHISEENNAAERLQAVFGGLHSAVASLGFATQEDGHDWRLLPMS